MKNKELDIEKRFIEAVEFLEYNKKLTSRNELAEVLDYKKQSISEIMAGRMKVNPYVIRTFCTTFNINILWVLMGEGEIENTNVEKNFNVQQNNGDGDNNHCILNVGEANEKLQQLEAENRYLKKEIELKDKIISLLESKN